MNLLLYSHVHLTPREQIGLHSQTTWELSYVKKGRGRRQIGDTDEPFGEGELVLIPPRIPHQWIYGSETEEIENITVCFEPSALLVMASEIGEMQPVADFINSATEAVAFEGKDKHRLLQLLFAMDEATDAVRCSLLLLILATVCECTGVRSVGRRDTRSEAEKRLDEIRIFIECNFRRDISIDSIAQHVGMNGSSLCSFYRKHRGETLMQTVTDSRISLAKELLRSTALPVQQVCYKCGFRDIPHFCRVFRQHTGLSTTAFRKAETAL